MSSPRRFMGSLPLLLTLALFAWLGAWGFRRLDLALGSARATAVSLSRDFSAPCLIIRRERCLQLPERARICVEKGSRVGVGDCLAQGRGLSHNAPAAGLFAAADGFEHLSPGILPGLDPQRLRQLLEEAPPKAEGYKLVEGSFWYIAALLPAELAESIPADAELSLGFPEGAKARVLSLSPPREGLCVLVLRCGSAMAAGLELRRDELEFSLGTLEGLRIPAAALRSREDGSFYVLVHTAAGERERSVTVLQQTEDWALVAREDSPHALLPGDRVLLPRSPHTEKG